MNSSQQYDCRFERESDSVMTRTTEGIINFWNRSAEALYGWRKEEAIGRVSHDLLQTQFPKPLKEIESELMVRGRWEGKLIHTARDGSRLTVHSRWSLDPSSKPEIVVEINEPSPGDEKDNRRQSTAAVFANLTLAAGLCACLATFLYYVYYYNISSQRYFVSHIGVVLYQVAPAGAALLLLAAFRLSSTYRINLALVLCSIGFSLYGAELLLSLSASRSSGSRTLWGDAYFKKSERKEIHALAKAFNIDFDTRSRLDVIRELRRQDIAAVPSIAPITLLKEQGRGTEVSEIRIDGQEILPLGGISNSVAVLCNETGRYSIYDSDERGFHNPRGIWKSKSVTIAAVGDSFTEGSCISSDRNFMALIRKRYPQTINLGMSGEGPLLMFAAIMEYLPIVKPKVVLWFFYEENDFVDLFKESKTRLLRQYIEGKFNQGLFDRQPEIDRALMRYVEQEMAKELAKRGQEVEETGESVETRYRSAISLDFLKLGELRGTLGLVYGRSGQDSKDWYSQGQFDLFRTVLLKAKHSVEDGGGSLYFVYLPARDRYANAQDYHREAVLDVVKEIGLPIVDVHAAFQRESDPMKFFPFRRFGHYNEEGNRIVAEEVLKVISK
jgi:PAS domain S-box-containing protein